MNSNVAPPCPQYLRQEQGISPHTPRSPTPHPDALLSGASVTTSSVDTTARAAINIGPARYRQTMNEWMSEEGKQVVGPSPAS